MSKQRGAVLIRVTDDALIVANDGRAVSRLGVLALCASDLSEKSGREDEQPEVYPDISDSGLLRAIAESSINVYRADPNRPKRDLRHERGVKADYGGRYLWELLQNADDALADDTSEAAELIGMKGLGFISVLEVTDRPEIFSPPFAFHFSRADTEALLQSRLGKKIPAPTFEIPHAANEPPEVAAVLRQGYVTAVRLPFRNAEVAGKVRDDVEQLDCRFLLLLQHVARLRIEVSGRRPLMIDVTRSPAASDEEEIVLATQTVGGRLETEHWAKWSRHWSGVDEDKRLSVAVCLPLDRSAVPHALRDDDKPTVHVFFPTDEAIGARAIVHASLDVTENRKHFRASERNALVYPQMRELVTKIVAAIPAGAALDAFGCIDPKTASGAARELASTILDAVKETPFVPTIGDQKLRPREVMLWNGKLGTVLRPDASELKSHRLLHPSISGRNAVLQTLQAKTIGPFEFFSAMRYCRNGSPSECERAVDVMLHEGLPMLSANPYYGWLEEVPCWWTEAGKARSIAGGILLLSRPQGWPKSVPADALSSETRRHLSAIDTVLSGDAAAKHKHAVWSRHVAGRFVRKGEYLEQALLPAMERMTLQDWERNGWDILRWYREWSPERKFDEISVLPILSNGELEGSDVVRRRLSRALRLPTDKGWRAAEQCYAGRAWEGPQSFGPFFRGTSGRAVVQPLRSWREPLRGQTDLPTWKGLLRFAGVAWEPKLVATNLNEVSREYANKHLANFNRSEFDLRIEHFPECLATENRLLALLEAGRTLASTAQKYPARYIPPNKQKSQTLKVNFAQHQLETAKWLPHRRSLLFPEGAVAVTDAYLAGKGIEGLLPEIDLPDIEPRRRGELLRFLRDIGIKESLPRDGFAWIGWMERLADASYQMPAEKSALFDIARTLYRKLFAAKIDDMYPFPRLRLPCYAGGDQKDHLAFVRARDAKWLDQPIFEAPDIRRALLAYGYRIFILFLNQADRAEELLGIGRLSEAVSLEPISAGIDDEGTTLAGALYLERIRALRAVIPEVQRSLLTEELRIEATSHLSISIRAEGGAEIAETEVRAFRNRHGTLMIAGDGSYHRSLGLGLAHYLVGDPRHTAVFDSILSAADEREVIDRLRDQGVPAQELEAVHAEMSKERAIPKSKSNAASTSGSNVDETVTPASALVQSASASDPSSGATTPPAGATPGSAPTLSRPTLQVQRLGTQTWTSRGTGHWDPSAAAEAGRHAENWLHAKLTAAFPGCPIARNERDSSNRESDLVLRLGTQAVHIEAKRLGTMPGYIYWSDLEFAKCGALGDEYCIALLLPTQGDYAIAWIWRPVVELASAERYVDWIWDGRRSDQLPDGDWQPISPPSLQPRFTYRVLLTQEDVDALPKDASDLDLLKRRVAVQPTTEQETAAP